MIVFRELPDPNELAKKFHDEYERLAPTFQYSTRNETRNWDPNSANGQLMVAVCQSVLEWFRTLSMSR